MAQDHTIRRVVSIVVVLIIAAIHAFRLGSYLSGQWYRLYYSYASDILIPFAAYYLLCLNDTSLPFLRRWEIKAGIVFVVMTFSEIMQYFDIYFFGVTFDMADILMFGIGTTMAVVTDRHLFTRLFSKW